jgi:hypothetical protein
MFWKKFEDKRKNYFLPATSILHQVEMINVKVLSTEGPQSAQKLGILSKPKLVTLNLILHLDQRSCSCWKHLWKTSFGMTVALTVALCWIYSMEVKQWPYNPILRLRNSQNLHSDILENTVAKMWLEFSSSPKNVGLRGRSDKVHCHGKSIDCFPNFLAFSAAQYEL